MDIGDAYVPIYILVHSLSAFIAYLSFPSFFPFLSFLSYIQYNTLFTLYSAETPLFCLNPSFFWFFVNFLTGKREEKRSGGGVGFS